MRVQTIYVLVILLASTAPAAPFSYAWLQQRSAQQGSRTTQAEERRPLTTRGLNNLTAFTRLLGYVRHFHPSDEAARQDWDAFAVRGVQAVEDCRHPTALVDALTKLFGPVAPTLELFTSDAKPAAAPPPQRPAGDATLLSWRHRGFTAATSHRTYGSERIEVASPVGSLEADLGAGVSCRLPLSVWGDDAGTLPRPTSGEPMQGSTRPASLATDRATRLAAVALAWNVLQHFYPYFDVVKTDWSRALRDALRSAATDSSQRAFANTLARMVAALHDGHGNVYNLAQKLHVPPLTWEWIEGRLIITESTHASLSLGDVVLAIDGTPVPEQLARAEAMVSGATPQWVRYRALLELAWGEQGTKLRIDVQRYTTGERARVELTRDSPLYQLSDRRRIANVAEVEPGILYLDLDRMADADFDAALEGLTRAKGIIFDFRGYPKMSPAKLFAHLAERPLTSPQWLVPEITWPDHLRMSFSRQGEWEIRPATPFLSAKKVFLVDGRTISFAESCMGIVEHYRLGQIVGTPTAGTNGNATSFQVPGGLTVTFTAMKVLKHDGSQHHGVGIQPTILARRTRAGVAAGRDEVIERAIAELQRVDVQITSPPSTIRQQTGRNNSLRSRGLRQLAARVRSTLENGVSRLIRCR